MVSENSIDLSPAFLGGRGFFYEEKRMGILQVYTGAGKGKTTAAMGLALRASGHGMRVLICQFLKGGGEPSGEIKALELFHSSIQWKRFDQIAPMFIKGKVDMEALKRDISDAIHYIESVMDNEAVDLLILDELNVVLGNGWFPVQDLIQLLRKRPLTMNVVLTGRGAPEEVCALADLVTEMVEVKHHYQQGIDAREGIDY
jgi:cob(I)alamin adenosyltransferase